MISNAEGELGGGGGKDPREWLEMGGLREWDAEWEAVRLSKKTGQLALKYQGGSALLALACSIPMMGIPVMNIPCCRLVPKLDHNEQRS